MASAAFEVDDLTDEDFFDKLVKDDDDDVIGFAGCVPPSYLKADGSGEAEQVPDLVVSEVSHARVDSIGDFSFCVEESEVGEYGGNFTSAEVSEGSGVVKDSNAVTPGSLNVSGELSLDDKEGALSDCMRDDSAECPGMSKREVQRSSFNPEKHVDNANGLRSYSDFFNNLEDDSSNPFADLGNTDNLAADFSSMIGVSENPVPDVGFCSGQGAQNWGQNSEHSVNAQDLNGSQYGEKLYPGWKYDPNTGSWHQLDGYQDDLSAITEHNTMQSADVNVQSASVAEQRSNVCHLQQAAQSESLLETVAEAVTDVSLSNWNQISTGTAEYPAYMVFDPQYPGWYYDTIVQEWRLLESSYPAINQSATSTNEYQFQSRNADNYGSHGVGSLDHVMGSVGSASGYSKEDTSTCKPQSVDKSETTGFVDNKQVDNIFSLAGHVHNSAKLETSFRPSGSVAQFEPARTKVVSGEGISAFHSFMPSQQFPQQCYQINTETNQHLNFEPAYSGSYTPVGFQQQQLQRGSQSFYASSEGRSSAGRPPHALVTFGFGGRLVVLKKNGSCGSEDSLGGVVNVINLMELVKEKTTPSNFGLGACDYLQALCLLAFPGPLVGGNVGNKELNKWIDEKIGNYENPNTDCRNGELLKLLFSLLIIACQYYGKLRSPFGTDAAMMESDTPELAVAKLLRSSKQHDVHLGKQAALAGCLQKLPTEGQIQATALEVQKLLVAGRKKEALECATEGYLWGPALILASQLGDQFYCDTLKQMAVKQLVAGSPLQTLCLLIAGQRADLFSSGTSSLIQGSANTFQQALQTGVNCMLDKWEENLAIITVNRTKGDELVVIHLGDCLWKERGEVTAAHVCYLIAESDLEPYSDCARLCLIGADHLRSPRTYASPQAIQITELYEYAKVLGNSQIVLLPFQPYKIVYAYMLAEVGKVADALKYCQAILKLLKTGRVPEVDSWKQLILSLGERLRVHQQSGYITNLTPTKIVGRLLTFFDSTSNRGAGSSPPPVPSVLNPVLRNELSHQPGGLKTSNGQSTLPTPSLMPSASVEPISEWTGVTNQLSLPSKSSSELEFVKCPSKVDSSMEANLSVKQEKPSDSGRSSRFGRFGSQLLQKTVGMVLRPRPDRQAKLGEKNKFYYDEKLKRWVEEGAELPTEGTALAPPPTFSAFQSVMPNNDVHDAEIPESFHTSSESENHTPTPYQISGIPPVPPSSNQFSARGLMSGRSRYVDTFNKGSGTPNSSFQSPTPPSSKSVVASNAKFFVPSPVATSEETIQGTGEFIPDFVVNNENPQPSFHLPQPASTSTSTSTWTSSLSSSSPAVVIQRFPSMDNVVHKGTGVMEDGDSSLVTHARRTASWNGRLSDVRSPV